MFSRRGDQEAWVRVPCHLHSRKCGVALLSSRHFHVGWTIGLFAMLMGQTRPSLDQGMVRNCNGHINTDNWSPKGDHGQSDADANTMIIQRKRAPCLGSRVGLMDDLTPGCLCMSTLPPALVPFAFPSIHLRVNIGSPGNRSAFYYFH